MAVILPLLSARSTLSGLKKITMDDSEFSSAFSVYSADAASAMYAPHARPYAALASL